MEARDSRIALYYIQGLITRTSTGYVIAAAVGDAATVLRMLDVHRRRDSHECVSHINR